MTISNEALKREMRRPVETARKEARERLAGVRQTLRDLEYLDHERTAFTVRIQDTYGQDPVPDVEVTERGLETAVRRAESVWRHRNGKLYVNRTSVSAYACLPYTDVRVPEIFLRSLRDLEDGNA